jgi:LacI family transcriptional regulator
MKKIGILIERQRAYGRQLCEGIVRFAQERSDWVLNMLEWEDLQHIDRLKKFDGFIVRIFNEQVASVMKLTNKPIVDVYVSRERAGVASSDQLARCIGQMAVRHFIEHKFTRFAFFGHEGKRYSDLRRDAFVHCLKLNHFACDVYKASKSALQAFDKIVLRRERYQVDSERKSIVRWLTKLEKPIAVFCSHDLRAYQLCSICREEGIKVPSEVGILGVDNDSLLCNFTDPTLSSIDPNAEGIGFAAAEELEHLFAGGAPHAIRTRPGRLIERGSTKTYPINPPWLSDALVFIKGNVAKRLTAADVYRHVGKSHTLVNRVFHDVLNTTIAKEIAATRIAEAKRLLQSSNLSLSEVANLSGFASPEYFTNSFSSSVGQSPTSYRNSKVPTSLKRRSATCVVPRPAI